MNDAEKFLYRTRQSIDQASEYLGIPVDDIETPNIQECTSCFYWDKPSKMVEDLDGNLICHYCAKHYGL